MLSGMLWYWLQTSVWWGLRIGLFFFVKKERVCMSLCILLRDKSTVKIEENIGYITKSNTEWENFTHYWRMYSNPSFIIIKALTIIGLLNLICRFILLLFFKLGILIRFSHNMQQAGFYHNTALCFCGFHSAHNSWKRMEKREKKHDWWLWLEAHKQKQPALID